MTVDPRTKAAPSALQRGLETALGAPLAIRRVPIDSNHLDPAHARSPPQRNLDAIRSSLARFGQAEPLVVQRPTGRVIGGNGHLVAMKALGWTECDIVELDIADTEATALGIALNRTAELAEWDDDTLAQLLQSLRADGAIDGLGFDAKEIDELLRYAGLELPSPTEDPSEQAPREQPVSQRGDLWILGSHRPLCGDSTSSEEVARLMAGETAVLLATDPPYLVSIHTNTDSWGTLPPGSAAPSAPRTGSKGKERNLAGAPTGTLWAPSHCFCRRQDRETPRLPRGKVVRPARFELTTFCSGGRRSIQLSYGRPLGGGSIARAGSEVGGGASGEEG